MKNPLLDVLELGQSLWLDNIQRRLLTSGSLKRLIEEDGLRGVTSNPAIFEKAIGGSSDYDAALAELGKAKDLDAKAIFERLAIKDIQDACDLFQPVYRKTQGRDGYVSMEVSPLLAHDTQGTIEEAKRLWKAIGRDNVMIKIPGTPAGVPAIEACTADGLNINVTLLFSLDSYEKVAQAFISGLEKLSAKGGKLDRVASVASFFVSRIDTLVDSLAQAKLKTAPEAQKKKIERILGQVGIANAKLAYQRYKELFGGARWQKLAEQGAQTQRLLWASTSTKNPAYRDVYYVEELMGPDTVDTVPPATLDAFRDHGKAGRTLEKDLAHAQAVMATLGEVGISMKEVTDTVLTDAVRLFVEPFNKLLATVEKRRQLAAAPSVNPLSYELPPDLLQPVMGTLEDWQVSGKVRKLWNKDASLWTGRDEGQWMGWLDIVDRQLARLGQLERFSADVSHEGFTHAVVLGMGGSSMAPEVLSFTFGPKPGHPKLHILDSTDPAQVRSVEQAVDLKSTLFIVASKSGSTLEPNVFKEYFFHRIGELFGKAQAGRHFVAVTDPDSKMQKVAESDGFRNIFFGVPSIGGRYSALSDFGMVPAAVLGLDLRQLLGRAQAMARACSESVAPRENAGVLLGVILGTLARGGRDKLTIIASPGIGDFGAWLEQLIAESTGKNGKAIVPVDREGLAPPDRYGADRLFVYLRLGSAADAEQDRKLEALAKAGQPVIKISVPNPADLAQEFFRWEIATAVAGAILGINPFDQPDVEASKVETRKLTDQYEKRGALPAEKPFFEGEGLKLFADAQNASALEKSGSLTGILRAHFARLRPGDYAAFLGFIEMNEANEKELQAIRHLVRDKTKAATCLGFGPRFLHSTGQAYKGGPNSGVFLQVTCEDAFDLPVPGHRYSFGIIKAAQARGDFQVLSDRGRRALRVHLGKDVRQGFSTLRAALAKVW